MRLMTWNCRGGGFRRKCEFVSVFKPDILAVQEVEPLERLTNLAGVLQPTFKDRISDPLYLRRGIGTFSYTGLSVRPVDRSAPMPAFRRYEVELESLTFNLVAVWPAATRSVKTSYRQAHDGLARHEQWIRERPTVILGDFNANANFKGRNWSDLLSLLDSLGLASAYHRYFNELPGKETRPTHFHTGRKEKPFHLDYCFVPKEWTPHVKEVQVGAYADWHELSDHVPLIVDLGDGIRLPKA